MKTPILIQIFVCLLLISGIFVKSTLATSQGEDQYAVQSDALKQIERQISDTQKLLEDTRQKKTTLQNEIAFQDNQIKLTQLKIQQTQTQINQLSGQINTLETSLSNLSQVFAERAVNTYKLKRTGDDLMLLLSATNVDEFISRFDYLQRIQQNDRDLLLQMQTSQTNYVDQRSKVEVLNDKLKVQEASLDQQKANKENLLKTTKNDEKKYQDLIASLKADADSIQRALASLGRKIGQVKKGDIIATVASTGCSTGPHLHFEVFENAKVVTDSQGRSYVQGDRVNPHQDLDNGKLSLPLPGANINTEYGQVAGYMFNGGIHTGLDFGYGWGNTAGRPIYAAADGIAYAAQDSQLCSGYENNGIGKGIIIDHQNGLVTLYWHLP